MFWYGTIFLFSFVLPFAARFYQDRIPLRESHQALVLSLVWLGMELMQPGRPSNNAIVLGWLFIYAFGSLVLLYGRVQREEEDE